MPKRVAGIINKKNCKNFVLNIIHVVYVVARWKYNIKKNSKFRPQDFGGGGEGGGGSKFSDLLKLLQSFSSIKKSLLQSQKAAST